MGVGSLVAPMVVPRLLRHVTPGKGRYAKALLLTAAASAVVTTAADRFGRVSATNAPRCPGWCTCSRRRRPHARRRRLARAARAVASVGGVATVVTAGTAMATAWASRTTPDRFWRRRVAPNLGPARRRWRRRCSGGTSIYYWNHRFMHESRALWAVHVVHHSSERYNLSTALRQPVADAFGVFSRTRRCVLGCAPPSCSRAGGNLLYQFWIHTEHRPTTRPVEVPLNTPSHHRVHHGSNRQYLDRNHGSILIVWDRLFGTFEDEDDPVIYGLTRNIGTFRPGRIATHEHMDMLRDVARSRTWRDRLSFVVRGPGWAYRRRAELDGDPAPGERAPPLAA